MQRQRYYSLGAGRWAVGRGPAVGWGDPLSGNKITCRAQALVLSDKRREIRFAAQRPNWARGPRHHTTPSLRTHTPGPLLFSLSLSLRSPLPPPPSLLTRNSQRCRRRPQHSRLSQPHDAARHSRAEWPPLSSGTQPRAWLRTSSPPPRTRSSGRLRPRHRRDRAVLARRARESSSARASLARVSPRCRQGLTLTDHVAVENIGRLIRSRLPPRSWHISASLLVFTFAPAFRLGRPCLFLGRLLNLPHSHTTSRPRSQAWNLQPSTTGDLFS